MKRNSRKPNDELRPEYRFDYSKAVRGKYYRRLLKEGANGIYSFENWPIVPWCESDGAANPQLIESRR